jgi:hypothetical protein
MGLEFAHERTGSLGRTMTALKPQQTAAISRLFSSSVVRELARRGRSPVFTRLARQSLLLDLIPGTKRVFDLFEVAFSLLQQEGYRDEYVYKAALVRRILFGRHSLQTASILNEFRVGECKADLAILNGTATVYEVKSERDSLVRLRKQVAAYATVFAKVNVIASEDHISAVEAAVPEDVGILVLNRRYQVSPLREAREQPEKTSSEAIFNSIRTQEARLILALNGITVPAVPNTALYSVLRKSFVQLDPVRAHEGMVRVLKKTRNLLPLSTLVSRLPDSLQTAALSVPMRKLDHTRLVNAVNTSLIEAAAWA